MPNSLILDKAIFLTINMPRLDMSNSFVPNKVNIYFVVKPSNFATNTPIDDIGTRFDKADLLPICLILPLSYTPLTYSQN